MPDIAQVLRWKHGDESFASEYVRAREAGAVVNADKVLDASAGDLETHEQIGAARVQMQGYMWHSGRYNAQFADKPSGLQVNVGVNVVLPEAERVKLIERRDRALKANAAKTNVQVNTLPYSQRDIATETLIP